MELLYLIDRTLTHALQSLARRIERKALRLPLFGQRFVIALMLYILGSMYVSSIGKDGSNSLFEIPLVLAASLTYFVVAGWMGIVLQWLHVFFDKAGAQAPDKLYENGYKCWGDVVATGAFFVLGTYLFPDILAENFIEQSSLQLGMMGYLDFVVRRKGPGSKRKKGVTAALQALLERCKDFIPRPIPEGASSVVLEHFIQRRNR